MQVKTQINVPISCLRASFIVSVLVVFLTNTSLSLSLSAVIRCAIYSVVHSLRACFSVYIVVVYSTTFSCLHFRPSSNGAARFSIIEYCCSITQQITCMNIVSFSANSQTVRQNMLKCSTDILSAIQGDCQPQETIMVGTTLQNMMGAYEGVCKYTYCLPSFDL